MDSERVLPTFIYYFFICKRKLWLASRNIDPCYENELIQLGSLISESSYKRERRQVVIESFMLNLTAKLDLLKTGKKGIMIGEVKKSSSCLEASKMQLAYYLYFLKTFGVEATGILLIPKEKKKIEIVLTPQIEKRLMYTIEKIREIIKKDVPPKVPWRNICNKCGYSYFCWS
ncbi:MAG: CRISPR-associated protein Cas4 [candidate division WOR-3 bacterium]